MQWRVLDVLLEYEGLAVETSGLRHLVGGHLSNLPPSARSLVRRRMITEWSEGGRRYYELSIVAG